MKLSESTFQLYAAKCYDNPQCTSQEEFEEDLKRFHYLRKLFSRYIQSGELKERLILNHLIIIYNCFGPDATNMLFMKLEEYHTHLAPFIRYLNYMPLYIEYNGNTIHTEKISDDEQIKQMLRRI